MYCVNEDIYIGLYQESSDSFTSYEPYVVLDYVYEYVDKNAEFRFSLGGYIGAYLNPENIEKLGLKLSENSNAPFTFSRHRTEYRLSLSIWKTLEKKGSIVLRKIREKSFHFNRDKFDFHMKAERCGEDKQ